MEFPETNQSMQRNGLHSKGCSLGNSKPSIADRENNKPRTTTLPPPLSPPFANRARDNGLHYSVSPVEQLPPLSHPLQTKQPHATVRLSQDHSHSTIVTARPSQYGHHWTAVTVWPLAITVQQSQYDRHMATVTVRLSQGDRHRVAVTARTSQADRQRAAVTVRHSPSQGVTGRPPAVLGRDGPSVRVTP